MTKLLYSDAVIVDTVVPSRAQQITICYGMTED
jgi:hypothetical protein